MVDQYISAKHIEKLGHKIQEIRERALFNIISKLDNGVLFDNDLARSKDLFKYLCKWFLFEPCSQQAVVFSLLKRILKSDSGKVLVSHIGKCILQKELQQIQSYLEPQYHIQLEELLKILNSQETECIVPPLVSDVPLSYRSDGNTYNVGSTATSIRGIVQKESSLEPKTGPASITARLQSESSQTKRAISLYTNQTTASYQNNLPNYTFQIQLLIEPDRHVLQSIEKSLTDFSHPSALLHSCQFFNAVLINDFPPEIFLQRPRIVMEFYNLLNCGSTRITNAVLNCFHDLTKALHLRILHENDVSMRNYKFKRFDQIPHPLNTPSSTGSDEDSPHPDNFESQEEVELLRSNQIPTPKYCLWSACAVLKHLLPKKKEDGNHINLNQVSVNLCLILLEELLDVIPLTIRIQIWDRPQTERSLKILKDFNEVLVKLGEVLEYFRLESLMTETDLNTRAIYLHLVHSCVKTLKSIVPLDKTGFILPNNLRIALSNCLLDVALARLYPALHEIILDYVKSFSDNHSSDHLKKYEDMKAVCNGMTSAMKFLKTASTSGIRENLISIYQSLPCLEFIIGDLGFIKKVVDFLSESLPQVSENEENLEIGEAIILSLLAYNTEVIREEAYLVSHRKVLASIGPKLDMSYHGVAGAQILFLLNSKVIVEVAAFGLNSTNQEICRYSENILNYLLKCKILVCETIWDKIIQSLLPALPIMACYANRTTPLGKSIVGLMDPDTSKDILLPEIAMLKTNIQFLFLEDVALRDEAFSRLCWLLSSQSNCRDYLPKVNMLYDNSIACACLPKTPVDVNKARKGNDHFYQPSSLEQVLTVLKSPDVEPSIRRSALNQISVMMEDVLLHRVFLNSDGLAIVTSIFETALTEKDYSDYPDAVIPIISILKNLCFHQQPIRDELSNDVEIFYWILRGLFMFFTEEQLKQDAASLLFLLIFKDFVQGSLSRGDFSMPAVVSEKMKTPFQCGSHWKNSSNTKTSLKEKMVSDQWCLTSIQIQWNCELVGGFHNLVQQRAIDYNNIECADMLKLSEYDLEKVKTSSVHYCIGHYLNQVENSTSHVSVAESVDLLTLYVHLYKSSKIFETQDDDTFLKHPWQRCFLRFLKSLPSSNEDLLLLNEVVVFLNILVSFYTKNCWITTFLKDNQRSLLDFIGIDSSVDEDAKIIGQALLKLLTTCVRKEQRFLEYYPPEENSNTGSSWKHVVKLIVQNLKSSGAEHFYNLAYLDSLLACLVHMTAKLGWSSGIADIQPLVSSLRELLDAFHKGKGASASFSVMGLSITRHSILILNHLLAELQHLKVKGWESCFLDEEYNQAVENFMELWTNRDVVVRAAALQLLGGLTASPKFAGRLAEEVEDRFYECAISILLEADEAAVVRENAAQLLANLAGMSASCGTEKIVPANVPVLKKSFTLKLITFLEENRFFSNLETIIEYLFTLRIPDVGKPLERSRWIRETSSSSSSSSVESGQSRLPTTPGLIKSLAHLVHNILILDMDNYSRKLQEMGLVKLFFRTLCNPSMEISHTSEVMLYCDIMEMNISVCSLLIRLAGSNIACLGTIIHTRDCLSLLISLLDPKIYNNDFPQLIYLKNKLWSEIFNVISVLLENSTSTDQDTQNSRALEAASILSSAIFDTGTSSFLETLSESLSSLGSKDLQTTALTAFTCLTRTEILRIHQENTADDDNDGRHFKDLLDFTRSPKSVIINDTKENRKPSKVHKKSETKRLSDKYKMNLLEEAYYGKILPVEKHDDSDLEITFIDDDESALMSGAEICKILLFLYDVCDFSGDQASGLVKKKHLIISALSGLLCVSNEAKKHALQSGLLEVVIKHLRANHVRISLESGDYVKKVTDKRKLKVCPLLKETSDLVSLLNNFMLDEDKVKEEAAGLYLADVIHKFWVWFLLQSVHLVDVLKMLCTFTTGCSLACQTLPLTSSSAGSGPRKSPSSGSLLHSIVNLINKEMEQISRTHDLSALELSFNILQNCSCSLECRVLISKSNLFQSISRLHPASTKRQKPWENIELIWLRFLEVFTSNPEGQTCIAKISDVLELILGMTIGSKVQNRELAMLVLRNLAFYQPNKPRLLASSDFLCTLKSKLASGSDKEKTIVTVIIWSLIANSQKAKVLLKSAQLDVQLQNTIRQSQLLAGTSASFTREELDRMCYVLSILRDNDKSK